MEFYCQVIIFHDLHIYLNVLCLFSFNDQANRDFNKMLMRNVQTIAKDQEYDVLLIKRKYIIFTV